MRQAGTLISKQDAERFVNYLLTIGISSKVEPAADAWAVWIRDENQLLRGKEELAQFERAPTDERYRAVERAAAEVRRAEAVKERRAKKNYVDMREQWSSPYRGRPVTMLLIAASIIATVPFLQVPTDWLMFSLPDILHGQIWRLITPIFPHADTLHLVFNMWMLYDLGYLVERYAGRMRFLAMVLVIAIVSNIGQSAIYGPNFLGMSGVVYGLFGFAWIRGRSDPTSGLYLRSDVVFIIMAWFVLCFLNVIGHVANGAHAFGLLAGAALGYWPMIQRRLRSL